MTTNTIFMMDNNATGVVENAEVDILESVTTQALYLHLFENMASLDSFSHCVCISTD